jgi:hypothetical protein
MGGMADADTTVDAALPAGAATQVDAGMQADAAMRAAAGSHVVERSTVAAGFMAEVEAASTAAAVMVGAVDMVAADTGKFVRSLI